jgi:exodeoxyribonuclease V gamma subunit
LIARVVPGVQAESPFDPAVLAWRIAAAFEEPAWRAGHERLAAYLQHSDAVMRYELATRLAGLFDQYITFRPEWLAAWSRGESVDLGARDATSRMCSISARGTGAGRKARTDRRDVIASSTVRATSA